MRLQYIPMLINDLPNRGQISIMCRREWGSFAVGSRFVSKECLSGHDVGFTHLFQGVHLRVTHAM